ncbi:carbohydrate ABC transporter permease [Kitasatospora kifunensis]|uniref:N,N'-diacetylchitobiose transport system permease protein n=1 Tax=Kitasatospora kifunensis TaxID=58351 RepID=A0A7W7R1M0_KITKI|nr:sugar ABC transporter permease [Kitasatospora kifunensis]MBB4923614.1 N,N'-diacetylchitobiose transport system permease protein [Kitasatospora kifunensis]
MAVQSERVPTRSPKPGSGAGGATADAVVSGIRPPVGPTLLARSTPYLLLLPAIVATLALLGWPLVKTFELSFQNLNKRQLILHLTEWNGFDNYKDQLTDPDFWHTTGRSVVFTAINVVAIMVGGTLVGMLLNRLGKKMRILLQAGLILAWAMPIVASATVFSWLFDSRYGVVNWMLDKLGWHSMADYNWYSTQTGTFFVIILLIVWGSIPFVAFNMYAGLTTIPSELYEAARMDGAGSWKIFQCVVFPSLKPFFLSTTFLEVIWVFKAFTQVLAINAGGPGGLTATLPLYAYIQGTGNQHYGIAATIAVLTIVMLGVMMAYYFRIILKQEDEL